jgi:hypothetical protein
MPGNRPVRFWEQDDELMLFCIGDIALDSISSLIKLIVRLDNCSRIVIAQSPWGYVKAKYQEGQLSVLGMKSPCA